MARLGRRRGIDVVPGSVKQARQEAGLTLAEVAGDEVTRVAIWYVEQGRTRPSMDTLRLIAARTEKPLGFFTSDRAALEDRVACAACGVLHREPCLERSDITSEQLITRRA